MDFYVPGGAGSSSSWTGAGTRRQWQARYDAERTLALERAGIRVLRFWNTDVLQNVEGVLEMILAAVRPPSP